MAADHMDLPGETITNDGRHLPLALYTTWLSMNKVSGRLLRGLGLTFPQYLVLQALQDRAAMTVTQIGASLSLDSATLSPLLKRMEQRGLLSRQRERSDERMLFVRLTPGGATLRGNAEMVLGSFAQATGLTQLDHDSLVHDLDALRSTLLRVQ
jgi:DNA-binding MarR family transcriptional regulator